MSRRKPTPAQNKATLTNAGYYARLETALEKIPAPTVQDAVEQMHRQGNGVYVDAFSYIYPAARETFFIPGAYGHEVVHLTGRFGHTPFQENMQLAMGTGLYYGANLRHKNPAELEEFHEQYQFNKDRYDARVLREYQAEKAPELNRRDTAIYFAAGMYLRNKLDSFAQAGMDTKPYAEQAAFCAQYSAADSRLAPQSRFGPEWDVLAKAPYPLVTLSKQEWRAIEAVALGLCEPNATAYAQRLRPIKEALQHAGLFFDKPKFAEHIRAQQTTEHNGRM